MLPHRRRSGAGLGLVRDPRNYNDQPHRRRRHNQGGHAGTGMQGFRSCDLLPRISGSQSLASRPPGKNQGV